METKNKKIDASETLVSKEETDIMKQLKVLEEKEQLIFISEDDELSKQLKYETIREQKGKLIERLEEITFKTSFRHFDDVPLSTYQEISFQGIRGIECMQQIVSDGRHVELNPKTKDWDWIRVPKFWASKSGSQWVTVIRHTVKGAYKKES